MIQSKLKITFGQELIIGSNIAIQTTEEDYLYTYAITPTPTTNVGEATADLFAVDFASTHPTYLVETFPTETSTVVVITAPNATIEFIRATANYDEFSRPAFVTLEITRQEGVNILGLNGNNYLINNDIILTINAVEPIDKYTISFDNLSNQSNTVPFTLYPRQNISELNISPIIKSIFSKIGEVNQNFVNITVRGYLAGTLKQTTSVVRNFVRGGNRTQSTNQTIPSGSILRSSVRLPIWDGYATSEGFIDGNGIVKERPLDDVPIDTKDFRRVKSCDPLYLRFLNSKGYYSNWLFDDWQSGHSSSNIGTYANLRAVNDLGNESKFLLSARYKVDAEYIGIIQDLIDSPEIYFGTERIFNDKNSLTLDVATKVYSGSLNFKKELRYNPSVLWNN